jgi:hypothetical protein
MLTNLRAWCGLKGVRTLPSTRRRVNLVGTILSVKRRRRTAEQRIVLSKEVKKPGANIPDSRRYEGNSQELFWRIRLIREGGFYALGAEKQQVVVA